jgi:predicted glycogen debranching enzyme
MIIMKPSLPTMSVAPAILSNAENAMKTEWLVTNGLGGYASSTVLGLNTRKYHGLLVAAMNPPVDRRVLLAKLDEEILLGDVNLNLGASSPDAFSLAPLPTSAYRPAPGLQLKKTTFMPHQKNASIILYEAINSTREKATISVSPFINCRNFHSVTNRDQVQWNIKQSNSGQLVIAQPSAVPLTLALLSTDGRFVTGPGEWVETYYRAEAERGESSVDHNFKTGFFRLEAEPGETKKFAIIAIAGRDEVEARKTLQEIHDGSSGVDALYESELERRADLLGDAQKHYPNVSFQDWLEWIVLAADTFIVNRVSTRAKSVIAGYHWFADWGRDSLISLPGLTLVLRRFEDARRILQTFSQYCREGLIPNNFPDNPQQTPAYNTVDATFWYFNAVLQYLKYTGDLQFVQRALWPTLQSIIDHHVNGTMFGIHVDADGLLAHGAQLTWMDAAPEGKPVTPREGKAVEVQALWFNALKIMQLLATSFEQKNKAELYEKMAERAKSSFLEKFWNPQKSCLFDVISDSHRDDSLRPNQVIAASFDFTMLDKVKSELVIEIVWRQLLTPFGLRTLAPGDSRYVGRYNGDRGRRDGAYHNGTVWPWLLGPFVTAFLRLRNYDDHWRGIAFESFLKPSFTVELYRAGLGSISEIVDGDAPHESQGCIAQAWSVAEPLRAYFEDVLLKRPPYEQEILKYNNV